MEKRIYCQVFCDEIRVSNKVATLNALHVFFKHLTKT